MAVSYHMVNYCRFEIDEGDVGDRTLEGLCRSALGSHRGAATTLWERAPDRRFTLDDGSQATILLNRVADLRDAVFGELCLIEPHGLQALLDLHAERRQLSDLTTAEIFALEEREAPVGSQFIRGLLYWLSIGNHMFFIKTQSMTGDRLHAYLNWLLKKEAMPIDVAFRLQAQLDRAQGAGDVGDIRRLTVSGKTITPAPEERVEGAAREQDVRQPIARRSYEGEMAERIAEVVLGEVNATRLSNALGPKETLAASATIAVRGRRTDETRRIMRQMVNDVAGSTEAKVQVDGKDGKLTDGDAILRTRMPFNVERVSSTLLEFDNVADQLQEVYRRFTADGKIDA